jgi:threonine/homoserine/homoserine lactone efflux protein
MLDMIKFNFLKGSDKLNKLKESLANKGFIGSFLLGAIFALAFCPFSAVLFFGMFIPIALKAGDWIVLPAVFGLATGLPVLVFSFVLVYSVSKLGTIMGKIQTFEKWFKKTAAIIFILAGIYYLLALML